jgi:hypothetical protein
MNNKLASCEVILRSLQKDNEFIDILISKVFEVLEHITDFVRLGVSSSFVEIISKILFYFSVYKLNKKTKTVGEEYTNIRKNKTILIYILAQSLKSYLFKKISEKFNISEEIIDRLEDFQYAYFFINGKFYDLVQFIFGVLNYETVESQNIIDKNSFKLLGYLILGKISLELMIWIKKRYSQNKAKKEEDVKKSLKLKNVKHIVDENSESSCLLCLDVRKNSSLTPCGHLFCWECIISYLQTKPACPFCRHECFPQNVIYLQNYK